MYDGLQVSEVGERVRQIGQAMRHQRAEGGIVVFSIDICRLELRSALRVGKGCISVFLLLH